MKISAQEFRNRNSNLRQNRNAWKKKSADKTRYKFANKVSEKWRYRCCLWLETGKSALERVQGDITWRKRLENRIKDLKEDTYVSNQLYWSVCVVRKSRVKVHILLLIHLFLCLLQIVIVHAPEVSHYNCKKMSSVSFKCSISQYYISIFNSIGTLNYKCKAFDLTASLDLEQIFFYVFDFCFLNLLDRSGSAPSVHAQEIWESTICRICSELNRGKTRRVCHSRRARFP